MNKKGQSVANILMVAIVIIVGVVLFQVVAQQAGSSTSTVTINTSETLGANGASIYLDEYRAISSPVLVNIADGTTIVAGNYTVTDNTINPTTGSLSVKITTDDAAFASTAVYVQGTAQPVTYIADSGSRAMTGLIAVFFALAILGTAMFPALKELEIFKGM